MSSEFPAISGYQPCFVRTIAALPKTLLSTLVGQPFRGARIVWDEADDTFFADAPVVLRFGTQHIEVCVNQLDDLSITRGTIDETMEPMWVDDFFDLVWCDAPELVELTGLPLAEIWAIEYAFGWESEPKAWLLVGLRFVLDGGAFAVLNGLDENEIHLGELSADTRLVRLV